MKTGFTFWQLPSYSAIEPRACLPVLLLAFFLSATSNVVAQGDEQEVKDYIAKQKSAGVAPKPRNPNWKAGFTCNDLKQFSLVEYQECRYYYAVHGRFYKN